MKKIIILFIILGITCFSCSTGNYEPFQIAGMEGENNPNETSGEGNIVNLRNGLIGEWLFNGNNNDTSANNLSSTSYGSVTYTANKQGTPNSAVSFSNGGYITVSSSQTFNLSNYTLSFWMKTSSTTSGMMISKGRDINGGSFYLYFDGFFLGRYDYSNAISYSPSSLNNSQWNHIVIIVDSSNKVSKVYINGVLKDQKTIAPFTVNNSNLLTFGVHSAYPTHYSWSYPYTGALDDIRFYNRAVSESEVSVLFDTTSPMVSNNLLTISGQTADGFTVTWSAASDETSSISNLSYRLYYSTADFTNDVATAEQKTPFGDWTAGITSQTLTGLTAGNTYYFTVVVKDEAGNKSVYAKNSLYLTVLTTTTTNSSAILNISVDYQGTGTVDSGHKIYAWIMKQNPYTSLDDIYQTGSTDSKNGTITFTINENLTNYFICVYYDYNGDNEYTGYSTDIGSEIKPLSINIGETQNKTLQFGGLINYFDLTTYMPVKLNMTWTNQEGKSYKITELNTALDIFKIENVNDSNNGYYYGHISKDEKGIYVRQGNYANPWFLPVYASLDFRPLLYQNLTAGMTWTDETGSNGYVVNTVITIESVGISITTPGGQQYSDCVKLKIDFSYPNGYNQNPYLTQKLIYFQKGVGPIQSESKYNNSSYDKTEYIRNSFIGTYQTVFSDEFNGTVLNTSNWSQVVSNPAPYAPTGIGELKITGMSESSGNDGAAFLYNTLVSFTQFKTSVKFRSTLNDPVQDDLEILLALHYNPVSDSGYLLFLGSDPQNGSRSYGLRIMKKTSGTETILKEEFIGGSTPQILPNTNYIAEAYYQDGLITFQIRKENMELIHSISVSDSTYQSGKVGFQGDLNLQTAGEQYVYFDWFKLEKVE